MKKLLLVSLAVAILALSAASLAFYIWAEFFEEPYLSYKNLPFPPTMDRVQAGEIIPLWVNRCNSSGRVQVYRVAHSLVRLDRPGPSHVLKDKPDVQIEPGCHLSISDINRVPKDAASGIYRVVGAAIIHMTRGTVLIPWESEPFEVFNEQEGTKHAARTHAAVAR